MPNTTWNPADKSAAVTLTGGNLTATSSTASTGVRSIDKQTGGKFYWEITFNSSSGIGSGINNASTSLTGMYPAAAGALIVYVTGAVWFNGANTSIVLGSIGSGGRACMALDVTNSLFWARNGAAGNWNASGTANPTTGVGGTSISAIISTGIYATCTYGAAAGCTANFGDTAFAGVVPSGYTAGFPSGVISTQARAMILA